MSRLKKSKESKLSKLLPEGSRQRGGVQLKHTASRRYRVFSFEKGESCGSFPGARQHRRRRPRAPLARSQCPYDLIALLSFIDAYLTSLSAQRTGTTKFDPPKSLRMAKFTPMTLPLRLKSGPPEPPEVVAAS